MIDYDKPDDDPVVAEVRRIREEIFAEYNYDLAAYCEAIRQREATSGRRYAIRRFTGRAWPLSLYCRTFSPEGKTAHGPT